jgi:nucleoside-diphosphate-sugar epimerase
MIRPGSVYGPRNFNMGILYRFLDLGVFPSFGKGDNSLPFTYVENLVKATLLVEEKGRDGEKYFVVEDPVSLRDFVNGSAAALGRKLAGFYLPTGFVYGGLLVKEALERLFFMRFFPMRMDLRPESVTIASGDWICSNEKIKKLGYTPAVAFEESLARTVKWYKDNGIV